MREFTLDDLKYIMRTSVGVDESVDLDGDILDVPFTELGYDSLALLEIAGSIEQQFNVLIPDDAALDMQTPRAAIDCINRQVVGV
ncbi:MAG: acyl carrier protein [Egibacteraceae bacterium]